MLVGLHKHTMDSKGRLVIPQRFRSALGERFMITRGLDGCLWVYPMEAWKLLADDIRTASIEEGRNLRRFFFAHAEEVEPDAQGRVLVSQSLRDLGNLDRDVVFAGNETYVEIWDADTWAALSTTASEDDVFESLRKSGL